mgnify:CR=1 FL=1
MVGFRRKRIKEISFDAFNLLHQKEFLSVLDVREVEKLSQDSTLEKKHLITKKITLQDEIFRDFEESLEDKLGTKVSIKNKKIEIYFNNKNDLERILEIIGVE